MGFELESLADAYEYPRDSWYRRVSRLWKLCGLFAIFAGKAAESQNPRLCATCLQQWHCILSGELIER
jgi:hypothetical protein